MSVKHLSEEWAEQMTAAMNADEGFRNVAKKRDATIAWRISDSPYGEFEYHLILSGGKAEMLLGPPAETPDLQLYCSYETLVGIVTGQLSGRQAFQSKKLRSDSRLGRILKYIGLFHELSRVTGCLDIEY